MGLSVCENVISARASAFIVMAVDNDDKFYYSMHFPQIIRRGLSLRELCAKISFYVYNLCCYSSFFLKS
jgi:hypothetical protein